MSNILQCRLVYFYAVNTYEYAGSKCLKILYDSCSYVHS